MKFLKSYLPHLTGYLMGAAAIVSGLDPKLLPPQYAFVVALAGTIVNVGHHGYTAGTASAALQAAVSAASNVVAKAVTPAMLCAFLVGVSLTSGCTTMQKVFSPAAAPYVTAAVDTAIAIAEAKGVQAIQINRIAKAALAADSGAGASLATVTALVNAQMAKLNLPPTDLAAAQILELALTTAVQQQIGQNPSVAIAQADVAQVLNAVIAATAPYVVPYSGG